MKAAPAPNFTYRLATILAGLAALIACRFARDPFRAPFIVPLWKHITRAVRRLQRALARLAAGRASRPSQPHASGPHLKPVLPTGRAWLVRALGSEAAAYASQIAFLLAEPEAADALARSAAAVRPTPPAWLRDPPPARTARPWWLPPRRLRSG